MQLNTLLLLLTGFSVIAFFMGRKRSLVLAGGAGNITSLHSLPGYYGYFVAIWALLPALLLTFLWIAIDPLRIEYLLIQGVSDVQRSASCLRITAILELIQLLQDGDRKGGRLARARPSLTDHIQAVQG